MSGMRGCSARFAPEVPCAQSSWHLLVPLIRRLRRADPDRRQRRVLDLSVQRLPSTSAPLQRHHQRLGQVIASKPAFVVLGDHKANTDSDPARLLSQGGPVIRVLTYIPMNYGHSHGDDWLSSCSKDYTLHHACDNSPMDWDCTSINIATRISNAMASGYDGIFFDETPNDTVDDGLRARLRRAREGGRRRQAGGRQPRRAAAGQHVRRQHRHRVRRARLQHHRLRQHQSQRRGAGWPSRTASPA